MPCKGVRDAFYRGIGGIPYCRTKHPLHSCKVSERQKPGRLPPATKSLDFFEDFSRFSAHPSHNLLKSLCTKGKTNVRDVFYPSQIPHKSLTNPSHHAYAARSGYAYERQADRRVDVSVNVRDGLVQEKQHASSRRMLLVESKSEFDETPIACKIILSIWL